MSTNRPHLTCWVDDSIRAEFEGRGLWTSETWLDLFLASGRSAVPSIGSGDLATMDEDGRIRVTGRIKDIVIRGGENISVRGIEERLATHPGVAAVAVVGYPDRRLGERCCAVVVPAVADAAPTFEDLCTFLREGGVAKFALPERLHLIDALPVTSTGKVRKGELRVVVANVQRRSVQAGDRYMKQGYGIQDERA
ncbi:hypothetical protein [Mycobacterium sp. AZCC_0083]|uniref:AMP-binding enzyme n=1 Tax=Mycobacterium sp. AZCC_0083 TaxID=2735882 RepID=UPI0017AB3A5E|nr:hypothetical protein [Mycobacterium sp. AZCC_0083]MBB5167836.1 non-ribosomal peptide synthetase component E (peptide arylation enzyme) [Mycobacterium sp. AZCC_0083]